MSSPQSPLAYRLRVELLDSEPPIWRSLWVRPETSLEALHTILTTVMGWSGAADYQFKAQNPHFTGFPIPMNADQPILLKTVLSSQGDSLRYTYNLTQGWLHTVVLEAVQPVEPGLDLPSCIEGERNTPPEFCAGVWGYEELLDNLSASDGPDSDELWEKVGYDFDPEHFDVAAVNRRLRELEMAE